MKEARHSHKFTCDCCGNTYHVETQEVCYVPPGWTMFCLAGPPFSFKDTREIHLCDNCTIQYRVMLEKLPWMTKGKQP